MERYRQLNTLDIQEVEQEIELLMSISDNPSDSLVDEITKLIRLAKALGTRKEY